MKQKVLILFLISFFVTLSKSQKFDNQRYSTQLKRSFFPLGKKSEKHILSLKTNVNLLDKDDVKMLNGTVGNICIFSSNLNFLNCIGNNNTVACKVKSRLDVLNTTSFKLTNLEMFEENNILKLVEKGSKFTMVIPETNTQVLITLKNVDNFSGPGILIESNECWSNLIYFVNEFKKLDFRLKYFL